MAGNISLGSTQTALAIIAPKQFQAEIDAIRKIHDKAYGKWEPHLNVIYPFVPLSALPKAVEVVQKALLDESRGSLHVSFQDIDSFKHRKNGTMFLKPSENTEHSISQLRKLLVNSLSASENKDAFDYHPHLTLGQFSLDEPSQAVTIDEKARSLLDAEWETAKLAVLKRSPTGEMVLVQELHFGDPGSQSRALSGRALPTAITKSTQSIKWKGWKNCFFYNSGSGWGTVADESQVSFKTGSIFIASLNIMTDEDAPSFEKRLPHIEMYVKETMALAMKGPKILCLQEADPEILSSLYELPYFQQTFPYSSHAPGTPMQSLRNLVVLSSIPFRTFNLQFAQRHKSSLIIKALEYDLTVANVHLTSSLSNESVPIKKEQIEKISQFLERNNLLSQTVLAGDFNMTTSSETIRHALEEGIISNDTLQYLQAIIDPNIWSDAFIEADNSEMEDDEDDLYPGEEGSTFDRINNPLAAMARAPIDNRAQRYDRILYPQDGSISLQRYGRWAVPNNPSGLVSDHYGVFAVLNVEQQKHSIAISTKSAIDTHKNEAVSIIKDDTDVESLLTSLLPSEDDRQIRADAIKTLKKIFLSESLLEDAILAPLGSYAMNTYFRDSDMDILIIGSASPGAFWECLASAISKSSEAGTEFGTVLSEFHMIKSLVQIAELTLNGIKVDLQYCSAPELITRYG
jgi:endonuclease/exonuclease/phosphatase family metal-dependent hydrolase/2'-5' RNA ligase/predicted nucleotidyltransferase